MTVRFSVIMPVHNAAAYLPAAIQSVLGQDLMDLELIVVDDCSIDDSPAIVASVTDPRVIALESLPPSRGPGPPRNLALKRAVGQYIVFLDADDLLEEGALSAVDRRLADLGDPDVLLFDHRRWATDGALVANVEGPTLRAAATLGRFELARRPGALRLFNAPWTRCYRREFLAATRLSFPGGVYEDIPWTMGTLLRAESIGALDRVVVRYRQHASGSVLTSAGARQFDVFDQWDSTFADLGAHPEWEQYRSEVFAFMVAQFDTMLRNPVRVPGNARGAFLREASASCRRHAPHGWHPEPVGRGGQRLRQAALVRGWTMPYRLLAAGKPLVDSAKRAAGRVLGPGASPESAGPA